MEAEAMRCLHVLLYKHHNSGVVQKDFTSHRIPHSLEAPCASVWQQKAVSPLTSLCCG